MFRERWLRGRCDLKLVGEEKGRRKGRSSTTAVRKDCIGSLLETNECVVRLREEKETRAWRREKVKDVGDKRLLNRRIRT